MSVTKFLSTVLFTLSLKLQLSIANDDVNYSQILSGEVVTEAVRHISQKLKTNCLLPQNAKTAFEALIFSLNTDKFSQEFTFERFKHVVESLLFQYTDDCDFELIPGANIFAGPLPHSFGFASAINIEILDKNIANLGF